VYTRNACADKRFSPARIHWTSSPNTHNLLCLQRFEAICGLRGVSRGPRPVPRLPGPPQRLVLPQGPGQPRGLRPAPAARRRRPRPRLSACGDGGAGAPRRHVPYPCLRRTRVWPSHRPRSGHRNPLIPGQFGASVATGWRTAPGTSWAIVLCYVVDVPCLQGLAVLGIILPLRRCLCSVYHTAERPRPVHRVKPPRQRTSGPRPACVGAQGLSSPERGRQRCPKARWEAGAGPLADDTGDHVSSAAAAVSPAPRARSCGDVTKITGPYREDWGTIMYPSGE